MNLEQQAILSNYETLTTIDSRNRVVLVRDIRDGKIYVQKKASMSSESVFARLKELKVSGVPKIYEVLHDDDELIIIEEYIHGYTADEYFGSMKEVTEDDIIRFGLSILQILKRIHSLNPAIICRDIKPSNLMISQGRWYIVDFDIARNYVPDQDQDTCIMGTASYAPPEQHGFAQTDERSDIYSLAVTMNVLLTGHFPRQNSANSDTPLVEIIQKATMLNPQDRYQTVDSFAGDLYMLLQKNDSHLRNDKVFATSEMQTSQEQDSQRQYFKNQAPKKQVYRMKESKKQVTNTSNTSVLTSFLNAVKSELLRMFPWIKNRNPRVRGFARFKRPTTYVAIAGYVFLAIIAAASYLDSISGVANPDKLSTEFASTIGAYALCLMPYLYNGNYLGLLDFTLKRLQYGTITYWLARMIGTAVVTILAVLVSTTLAIVLF